MGKVFKTLHKLRPEPLPICTIHAFKFPHCFCPNNLPQSRSHRKCNVIKGNFNKTEDSKLFTQIYIQVLTSDAATGFTLWEGSVTLNNRCCPDQNRQKQINQVASTQI